MNYFGMRDIGSRVTCTSVLFLALISFSLARSAEAAAETNRPISMRPALRTPLMIKPRVYWVQLGAYASSTKAADQWISTQKTSAGIVAGLSSRVDVARIANKTVFRLLAGPIVTLADAQGVRERLRALYPDCFTR